MPNAFQLLALSLSLLCWGCASNSVGLVAKPDNAMGFKEKLDLTSAIADFARSRGFAEVGLSRYKWVGDSELFRLEGCYDKTFTLRSGQQMTIKMTVIDMAEIPQIDVKISGQFSDVAQTLMEQLRRDLRVKLSTRYGAASVTNY